jgi:hypothetical protein
VLEAESTALLLAQQAGRAGMGDSVLYACRFCCLLACEMRKEGSLHKKAWAFCFDGLKHHHDKVPLLDFSAANCKQVRLIFQQY